MNKEIYTQCLSNTKNLDLGSVQLRFIGDKQIPCLLTIYELIFPVNVALESVEKNISELENDNLGNGAIKGLFVLGLSNFEILLNDILNRFLSFYPQKLVQIKDDNKTNKENSDYSIPKEKLFSGEILNTFIKTRLDKLFYADIEKILTSFNDILNVKLNIVQSDYDKIIEMKETRNILLHNNLVVNEKYLQKTKGFKRATEINKQILIDKEYTLTSLQLIRSTIQKIEKEVLNKYSKYTLLKLFDRLWKYTFKSHIEMEDYFKTNIEKDIYDGPLKNGKYDISSSETLFLQIWTAQRFGTGIDNFSLVHLTPDNSRKVAFLTEVFGNLRLTRW